MYYLVSRSTYVLTMIFIPILRLVEYLNGKALLVASLRLRVARAKPRNEDIFLSTYPKSGTTWLQMILFQITGKGDLSEIDHLSKVIPHIEETDQKIPPAKGPRIFKTHLGPRFLPPRAKCIVVNRNGMDVAFSYYHHYTLYKNFRGTMSQFFTKFLEGQVAFGSWFAFTAAWLRRAKRDNVLIVSYEALKEDPERVVRQIIDFCDIPFDEKEMPRVLERISFDYMKQHEEKIDLAALAHTGHGKPSFGLLRKGKVGSGAKALSPAQKRAYNKLHDRYLKGKGLDHYRASETDGKNPAMPF